MKLPAGLKLRGNKWYFIAMVNGTRHYKSLGLPKECKAQAIRVVKEYWSLIARENLGIEKKKPFIESIFDNYIDFRRPEVTPKYYEAMQDYFHRVVKKFGNIQLNLFPAANFIDWLTKMKTRRTASEIQILVNAAFDHSLKLNKIENNPLENIPKIKHRRNTREPLSRAEFIKFGNFAMKYSCGRLLLFLMKTGCRFSEASHATWNRIDLEAGTFTLRNQDTKTRKGHKIGLSNDLCIMLNSIKSDQIKPNTTTPDSHQSIWVYH